MRDDIQYILSGKSLVSTIILSKQPAVTLKEAKSLVQFADDNNLWVENININLSVSQGAGQKISK
jgi:hypothetical protein